MSNYKTLSNATNDVIRREDLGWTNVYDLECFCKEKNLSNQDMDRIIDIAFNMCINASRIFEYTFEEKRDQLEEELRNEIEKELRYEIEDEIGHEKWADGFESGKEERLEELEKEFEEKHKKELEETHRLAYKEGYITGVNWEVPKFTELRKI